MTSSYGRYEPAGLAVSMWLQGTSRDGDPHDHVHCAIARMCLTLQRRPAGGRVDTMALRAQGGAAKLLRLRPITWPRSPARLRPALASRARTGTRSTASTQAQMDAYSSRAQADDRETARQVRGVRARCMAGRRTGPRCADRARLRGGRDAQGQRRCAD